MDGRGVQDSKLGCNTRQTPGDSGPDNGRQAPARQLLPGRALDGKDDERRRPGCRLGLPIDFSRRFRRQAQPESDPWPGPAQRQQIPARPIPAQPSLTESGPDQ
jgi:hypothetical protein